METVAPGDEVFCGNSAPCGVCRSVPARAREPVRGPALPAGRVRGEAARPRAGRPAQPAPAPRRPVARARPAGRAARLRRARARRRGDPPRRPRGHPRRRLARADAVRRWPPPRARGRSCSTRTRSGSPSPRASAPPTPCARPAAQRTSSGCASSRTAAATWLVIEAVGRPEAWELAVAMAAPGGTVNLFGGCARDSTFTVPTVRVHYEEVALIGTYHHTPALPRPRARRARRRRVAVGRAGRAGDRPRCSCRTRSRGACTPPCRRSTP